MKPRLWVDILIFVGGYLPLWLIFLVQNINYSEKVLGFCISLIMFLISLTSWVLLAFVLKNISSPYPSVKILSIKERSNYLLSYTLPYIASLIGVDINNPLYAISFVIFLIFLLILTYMTETIYHSPVLIFMGYCLTEIEYQIDEQNKGTVLLIVKKNQKSHLVGNFVKITQMSGNTFIMFPDKKD